MGGGIPICRQAQTKLEVCLYMFLWSPDTEAVLVAMSCFRHLCEEADIRSAADEVPVQTILPNYATFSELASVSNMMGTGRSTLQKRVMALLRRIEHPTPGNIEVRLRLADIVRGSFSQLLMAASVLRLGRRLILSGTRPPSRS